MQFFRFVYDWIMNAAFYLVIFTAVLQVLPGEKYQKYVRFFTGLVIVVLLFSPIFRLLGMEHLFRGFRENAEYRQLQKEMEQASDFLEEKEAEQENFGSEKRGQEEKNAGEEGNAMEGVQIHVEEIRIEE